MTDKALIRGRGRDTVSLDEVSSSTRLRVQHERDDGVMVTGTTRDLEALAQGPLRVKILYDTNLLRFYDNTIDVTADDVLDGISTRRRVPSDAAERWVHHLVQLDGPPTKAWVAEITSLGVDVIEPIGAYGLFLCAEPDHVVASFRRL